MTSTDPEAFRTEPPQASDERTMLEGYLDYQRGTLLWKCAGLSDEQLATPSAQPSGLTLLGLVRHLALVERWWFRQQAAQLDIGDLYDVSENPDAEFEEFDVTRVAEDFIVYKAEVAAALEAVKNLPLEHTFPHPNPKHDGEPVSLRWVYLHMIEEYARHNGHADLLRERIDGYTGE